MSFGGTLDASSERMLARVLSEMDGVDAFRIDPVEHVLTAYVVPDVATEYDLVRAIVATGMCAQGLVGHSPSGGEIRAC